MATRALIVVVFLTAASPARSAFADGANVFVFGGPSLATGESNSTEAGPRKCSLCTRTRAGETNQTADEGLPLLMLGIGLVGTEGRLRGGGEVLSVLARGRNSTGYSAFVTYAGLDIERVFLQAGLGVGAFWRRHSKSDSDRIAGVAHLELGLRLADGFSLIARGNALVAREETNHIATLGIQWVPGVFERYL